MAKTLDDVIAEAVAKAVKSEVQKTLKRMLKEFDRQMKAVVKQHLSETQVRTEEKDEKLVTIREAAKALGINVNKVGALIADGTLEEVTPPGCRRKVLQSSVTAYIEAFRRKAG